MSKNEGPTPQNSFMVQQLLMASILRAFAEHQMEWKFFAGASILVIALLGRWAPISDLVGGIAMAAVINWKLLQNACSRK